MLVLCPKWQEEYFTNEFYHWRKKKQETGKRKGEGCIQSKEEGEKTEQQAQFSKDSSGLTVCKNITSGKADHNSK